MHAVASRTANNKVGTNSRRRKVGIMIHPEHAWSDVYQSAATASSFRVAARAAA